MQELCSACSWRLSILRQPGYQMVIFCLQVKYILNDKALWSLWKKKREEEPLRDYLWLKVIHSSSFFFECFVEKICDCSELHSSVPLPAGCAPCKWSEFPIATKLLWTTWYKMDTILLYVQTAPSHSLWIHKCEDARGKTSEGYAEFERIHGNSSSLGSRVVSNHWTYSLP